MKPHTGMPARYRRRFAAVLILAVLSAGAWGEKISFRSGLQEESQTATVEAYTRDGTVYVPLGSVVKQLGGTFNTSARGVQFEFDDSGAVVNFGKNTVTTSRDAFTISRAVLESAGEAWIAAEDVPTLFANAFRKKVAQIRDVPAPPAAAAPAEPPLPGEEAAPAAGAAANPFLVIIDAGHGGNDTGVQGQALAEKDLTLALALKLQQALRALGVPAELTRTIDEPVPLLARINYAIQHRGGAFISLHAGASLADGATGFEVYYPTEIGPTEPRPGDGVSIADRLHNATLSKDLAGAVASAVANETGSPLRGVHAIRSRILQHVPMPGLMVEVGVLTNSEDESVLKDAGYQDRVAKGLAAGVRQYLTSTSGAPAAPTGGNP